MRASVRTAILLTAGLLLLCVSSAQATTIRARTTEQLFQDSGLVAVVQVREVKAERVGGRIITRVQLEVTEAFKGTTSAAKVEVIVPGGQVGEWVQRVEGAPSLKPGERCVAFLESAGANRFQFSGLEQGKLRIEEDASNVQGGVVRRTIAARLVDSTMKDATPPALTEPLNPYLDNLRRLARGTR